MQRLAILIIFCALGAGQVLRVPSSYKNGVKWVFGSNVFYGDVLARSNVDQVPAEPIVYKKELVAPIAGGEPATVYKKPFVVTDVFEKAVVPTAYKKQSVVQNVRRQQSVIPPVTKVHSVHSDVYKSEPAVQNVYRQEATVPIVRRTYPAASNVYQFKSQPIQSVVVHYLEPPMLQDIVPKVPAVNSQKKV